MSALRYGLVFCILFIAVNPSAQFSEIVSGLLELAKGMKAPTTTENSDLPGAELTKELLAQNKSLSSSADINTKTVKVGTLTNEGHRMRPEMSQDKIQQTGGLNVGAINMKGLLIG